MNAYDHFADSFLRTPDAVFCEDEAGSRLSYAELDQQTGRVATFLGGLGLLSGARVAAQVEKSVEGLVLYLGVLRAGLCFVPLNPAYKVSELEHAIEDSKPDVFVCSSSVPMPFAESLLGSGVRVLTLGSDREGTFWPLIVDASAKPQRLTTRADAPAVIIYTSGTTGRSKGALLTHGNLISNADVLAEHWRITAEDVLIHALPLFHVHGLFVALHPLLCRGGRLVLQRTFEAKAVLQALARSTLLMGVPTFYTRLLAEPELEPARCKNMRLFISGSAPLGEGTFRAFSSRTGHTILERYGMSEAGMIASNPCEGERRAGTVGRPLPGVSVRVARPSGRVLLPGEAGEIQVRGPNVFAGYFGQPERRSEDFTEDGYFKTGDVGVWSRDGYLSIVGREKDLIITGGYNVYPKELELLLDAFPEVEESAVVGLADPDFGEAVTAVLVLKAGASVSEMDVVSRMKGQLAPYKVPKRVHIRAELPRNAMGKVEKKRLREELYSERS